MRRWARFVLGHRKWVIGFWLLTIVVGGAAAHTVSSRLTVDFSLPGQPGTQASARIMSLVHNGGASQPYLVTLTMPAGESVSGHEARVAQTLAASARGTRDLRIVDEANTGDRGFRTADGHTAFALVFWRFNPSPGAPSLTDSLDRSTSAAAAGSVNSSV
ncbi:MAG: hypothetical protein ACR2LX_08950 [Jatrophihabitans sp.]